MTKPAAPPDVILLEGIQVPAALGVTAAERRMRRPVTLDLEVEYELRPAGRSDRIGHTLHYKRIFEVAEEEVPATLPVIRRVMEGSAMPAVALKVPLQVDARAADNWDEAH